jgi:hypothetical protein
MIVHQDKAVEAEIKSENHLRQNVAEVLTVTVVPENGSPFIPSCGDMIPTAGPLDSNRSSDAASVVGGD